jgi:hypothetical protein
MKFFKFKVGMSISKIQIGRIPIAKKQIALLEAEYEKKQNTLIQLNNWCQEQSFSLNTRFDQRFLIENSLLTYGSNLIVNNPNELTNQKYYNEFTHSFLVKQDNYEFNDIINRMHLMSLKENNQSFNFIQKSYFMNNKPLDSYDSENVLSGLEKAISLIVRSMIKYLKNIPGIKDFENTNDFKIMITNHLFDYFIVSFRN